MPDALIQRIVRGPLADNEIQTIATQLQSHPVRIVARKLFAILKTAPPSETTANVLSLFKELAIREPSWHRILDRSLAKRGRCPAKLRPTLRQLLAADAARMAAEVQEFSDILSAEVFADFETTIEAPRFSGDTGERAELRVTKSLFGRRRAVLQVTTALTDLRRMEQLARLLDGIEFPVEEFSIDFLGVGHTYVVGLAAVMAWCAEARCMPTIENASDRVQRYLDMVGFGRPIHEASAIAENLFTMAIEPIQQSTPELIAERLTRIIDHHMPISKQARSGLLVTFAELVENIQRHAGPSRGAFACAQVYPQRRKLTICIVDTGMGIANSIATGTNPELIKRLQSGEHAVKLATLPLITSKPGKHSGYGLYVVSELTVRNGGTFRIFSGNEILTLYHKGWRRMEHCQHVLHGWKGTWIALLFDLDSILPIGDVYNTLPPAEGTEIEEFF